jgi:hypothetical protein
LIKYRIRTNAAINAVNGAIKGENAMPVTTMMNYNCGEYHAAISAGAMLPS